MAIPGVDGSLRSSRLGNLSQVMRAKTGGIKGVRSLTGYLRTKSGEQLVFSIVSNQFASREAVRILENDLLQKLAQS
jgi:D-alanyl-D-alanine carboxypeptidase/D-alanyl-D-alanine-endopeptidase (penicillin-binding protein 4)